MVDCLLCEPQKETLLWQDRRCRVVLMEEADHPGYCRVVWNKHVPEMTDLTKSQRAHYMNVVYVLEQALRRLLKPRKMNLASIGNRIPHLHWHVVPRFEDDAHFPDPIWSMNKHAGVAHPLDREALTQALYAELGGRRKES
jgi:diadenosine tetraphosphate (Ap4A) HIT family hydrolase